MLVTHSHFDHIKNLEEYDKQNIKIYAHKAVLEMLNNTVNNASFMFNKPTKYKINNLYYIKIALRTWSSGYI